jgi:hypothetical protein
MRVPDHWWESYNGTNLHDGKIVLFDVVSQKWNLLLDTRDDGDDLYLMAYEAVCEYSNKESSTFNEYQLPYIVVREGDDQIQTEEGTLYSLTPAEEWTRVGYDDNNGRTIDPIEWTGGDDEFSISITDEELDTLKDDSKEIRYEKVFEWCLQRFGDDNQTLFEYQAAWMLNYMNKRIVEDGWTPKYYHKEEWITGDHVVRFHGACLGKMLMDNQSIQQIFCTREIFNAVPSIQASMTKNA